MTSLDINQAGLSQVTRRLNLDISEKKKKGKKRGNHRLKQVSLILFVWVT